MEAPFIFASGVVGLLAYGVLVSIRDHDVDPERLSGDAGRRIYLD